MCTVVMLGRCVSSVAPCSLGYADVVFCACVCVLGQPCWILIVFCLAWSPGCDISFLNLSYITTIALTVTLHASMCRLIIIHRHERWNLSQATCSHCTKLQLGALTIGGPFKDRKKWNASVQSTVVWIYPVITDARAPKSHRFEGFKPKKPGLSKFDLDTQDTVCHTPHPPELSP